MKARDLQPGAKIVIGHIASNTLTVTKVKPLDIEWDGDRVAPKSNTAFDVIGVLEDDETMRTITYQYDDEVEVA